LERRSKEKPTRRMRRHDFSREAREKNTKGGEEKRKKEETVRMDREGERSLDVGPSLGRKIGKCDRFLEVSPRQKGKPGEE